MNILLIEDDTFVSRTIAHFLNSQLHHRVIQTNTGVKGLELCRKDNFDLIISDIRMPGIDGIKFLKKYRSEFKSKASAVILLTGFATVDIVIEALRAGAFDLIKKPVNIDLLSESIKRAKANYRSIQEHDNLKSSQSGKEEYPLKSETSPSNVTDSSIRNIPVIGKALFYSEKMKKLAQIALRAHADREISVLIEGETGTGKDVFSRLIHNGESENSLPFISLNCASIPETLFETELFGYEGGAYTGSNKMGQKGKLELSSGGTLFLDEIGEMPLSMQPKLLKALQDRKIYRVGGIEAVNLNVRVICATNQQLGKLVEEGKFRSDLYYRINTLTIEIPPLRKRKAEILLLAQLFLEEYSRKHNKSLKFLTERAKSGLISYYWHGNVRELRNVIERSCFLNETEAIDLENLSLNNQQSLTDYDELKLHLPQEGCSLASLESRIVRRVLHNFGGNKSKTANYLGISYNRVRRIIGEM